MTSTISVGDRRRAALERLHGGVETPRRQTPTRLARRTRGAERRSREPRAEFAPEVLGPPPGTFYAIAGVVSVLVMLGLVMVLSASAVTEANLGHSPYRVFARQAMWAGFGLVALVAMVKISYRRWQRLVLPIAVLAVAAMAAPFAPGVGASVNGARSWVRVGPLSVQPSEFLKIAVVIVAADLLTRRRDLLGDRTATLFPLGALAAIGAGLCLAQGDLGAAVVLGAIVFSVAWVAGVPLTPLSGMAVAALGAVLLFVVSSPRRLNRFTAFMNIAEEKDHLAYQTYQGYLSMASGGLSGSGIGGSNAKLGYLPYAHSDFIFAVIADELGLIGTVAVIGGFVMLLALGVQTALAAPDRFGMLLAGGIAAWFGVQAIVNIGGVVGFMPVTGLTLPFFSAGGSSLFVSMTAAGLLLSVARRINAR
jgi:cell division protein FtsW